MTAATSTVLFALALATVGVGAIDVINNCDFTVVAGRVAEQGGASTCEEGSVMFSGDVITLDLDDDSPATEYLFAGARVLDSPVSAFAGDGSPVPFDTDRDSFTLAPDAGCDVDGFARLTGVEGPVSLCKSPADVGTPAQPAQAPAQTPSESVASPTVPTVTTATGAIAVINNCDFTVVAGRLTDETNEPTCNEGSVLFTGETLILEPLAGDSLVTEYLFAGARVLDSTVLAFGSDGSPVPFDTDRDSLPLAPDSGCDVEGFARLTGLGGGLVSLCKPPANVGTDVIGTDAQTPAQAPSESAGSGAPSTPGAPQVGAPEAVGTPTDDAPHTGAGSGTGTDDAAGGSSTGDSPTGDSPTGDSPTGDSPTGDSPCHAASSPRSSSPPPPSSSAMSASLYAPLAHLAMAIAAVALLF